MKNMLDKRSLENLKGVHPTLIKILELASEELDFTVTEGVRTVKRLQELYAKGRTSPGNIVTNTDGVKKKSNHQPKSDGLGYAVDLYAKPINVKDTVNVKKIADVLKKLAKVESVKLEWGGDWKMKDYPHFLISI